MKNCIFVLLCFFSVNVIFSQSDISIGETREVVISTMDSVLRFNILEKFSGVSPDVNKTYYWYSQNQVNFNQGGFYGKLLHGTYFLFNVDRRLVIKGDFKEGLKVGDWFRWHPNGNIAVHEKWKDGRLQGRTITYNSNGVVNSVEVYKNGVKHGRQFYYSEGGRPIKEVVYKKGEKHGKEILFTGQKPLVLKYKRGVLKKTNTKEKNKKIKIPFIKQRRGRKEKPDSSELEEKVDDSIKKMGIFKRFFSARQKKSGANAEEDERPVSETKKLQKKASE